MVQEKKGEVQQLKKKKALEGLKEALQYEQKGEP